MWLRRCRRCGRYMEDLRQRIAAPKIVGDLIRNEKPQVMVELGGYVGYSAVLFGDCVRSVGGRRYYSLERNPEFAAVIMSLVEIGRAHV